MLGAVAGAAAATSVPLALGVVVVAIALYVLGRSGVWSETVVALYWFTFCLFATVFASVSIAGFYFPFYAVFFVVMFVALTRRGLPLDARYVVVTALFAYMALASALGVPGVSASEVLQRAFTYAFGLIVALQIRSLRGLGPIAFAMVSAGTAISLWVANEAIRSGFAYRAALDVNQNVVALLIGLGLVPAICFIVDGIGHRQYNARSIALVVPIAIMVYALTLLASRGMVIALAVALVAVVFRALLRDRRALLAPALFIVIAGAATLLPGGEGMAERFTGHNIETGNERFPIWVAVIDAYTAGNVREIIVGHGFDSSITVVQQRYGSLTSTHNAYLKILFEYGLIGLGLFMYLHALLIIHAWRVPGALGLIMLGLVSYLLTVNLAMTPTDNFIYWTALGLAMGIGVLGRPVPQPNASSG